MHSLTASKPFLNPELLRNRNFALGLVIALIFGSRLRDMFGTA